MELLIVLAALITLDIAALKWGANSRKDQHPSREKQPPVFDAAW